MHTYLYVHTFTHARVFIFWVRFFLILTIIFSLTVILWQISVPKISCVAKVTILPNLVISSVQSLSRVWLFVTPWFAVISRSLLKLVPIESVMPSSHLILCRPLLLLPPIPPSIRVFPNESTLRMRWPKYWSFSFSISPKPSHTSHELFIWPKATMGMVLLMHTWDSHLNIYWLMKAAFVSFWNNSLGSLRQ